MENYLNNPGGEPLSYNEVLSMCSDINMDIFSEAHIREIEENGIPDLSGFYRCLYKWLSYVIDFRQGTTDADQVYELETDYLKHSFSIDNEPPSNYCEKFFEQSSSERVIRKIFLNQLIQDFSEGKQKAKECLKLLFSIYDKEKFKRMKKYQRITLKALLQDDFIPDYNNDKLWLLHMPTSMDHCAAYMAMAMSLDIELEPRVFVTAFFMNDAINQLSSSTKATAEKCKQRSIENKKKLKYIDEDDFVFSELDPRELKKLTGILEQAQQENGLLDSLLSGDVEELSYDTIDILKGAGIDISKLSKKDLTYLTAFANLANFYFSNSADMGLICSDLLYKDKFEDTERLYDRIAGVKEPVKTTTIAKKAMDASTQKIEEEAYLREIQKLRDKIRDLEYSVERQRDLYEKEKRRSGEYATLTESLPAIKRELHALREFAYNSAEGDLQDAPIVSREKMVRLLNEKNVLLVGGHVNWTSKLKELFPKWKFATPKEQGSLPVPENVDHVFIFTGCLCHSQFDRHMEVIAKRKIPMTYVARVNIEENIREFYKALS